MSGDWVGRRLGDLQILRRLGRGGMAEVYAARQISLQRDVAIKILLESLCRDPAYVKRFRREALAAAKLSHANIVMVLGVGEFPADGDRSIAQPYIVQELIDGENLKQTIARGGALGGDEVRRILVAVASALVHSAAAGITHRDIKPDNILRGGDGTIKVADFGLARVRVSDVSGHSELTQAGLTLGTPRYMSPEQIQGHAVDVRSDLYSLGVTAYHLLTGWPPFLADDPVALAVKHLHETPPSIESAVPDPATLDHSLVTIIERLMAKSPADRPASPQALLKMLHVAGSGEGSGNNPGGQGHGQTGQPGGPGHVAAASLGQQISRLSRLASRHRLARRRRWYAGGIAAAVAMIAGFMAARSQQPPPYLQRLRPASVPRGDSVDEQFLTAVARDDRLGWDALETYFGQVDSVDAQQRVLESRLQLARVLAREGDREAQQQVLRRVTEDPAASRLHRVLALAGLESLAETADVRLQLRLRCRSEFDQLKQNSPAEADAARALLPDSMRVFLELG